MSPPIQTPTQRQSALPASCNAFHLYSSHTQIRMCLRVYTCVYKWLCVLYPLCASFSLFPLERLRTFKSWLFFLPFPTFLPSVTMLQ